MQGGGQVCVANAVKPVGWIAFDLLRFDSGSGSGRVTSFSASPLISRASDLAKEFGTDTYYKPMIRARVYEQRSASVRLQRYMHLSTSEVQETGRKRELGPSMYTNVVFNKAKLAMSRV